MATEIVFERACTLSRELPFRVRMTDLVIWYIFSSELDSFIYTFIYLLPLRAREVISIRVRVLGPRACRIDV